MLNDGSRVSSGVSFVTDPLQICMREGEAGSKKELHISVALQRKGFSLNHPESGGNLDGTSRRVAQPCCTPCCGRVGSGSISCFPELQENLPWDLCLGRECWAKPTCARDRESYFKWCKWPYSSQLQEDQVF